MTDPSQKRDAGKTRLDLVPWNEFDAIAVNHTVEAVDQALKVWWSGRPHPLDFSIPARQIPGIARVLTFGAAKYAPRGWELGIQYSRVFAAACRHAERIQAGEFLDEESGLLHESHFWCNVLFLVVFTARGREDLDDRPDPAPASLAYLERVRSLIAGLTGVSASDPAPASSAKDQN